MKYFNPVNFLLAATLLFVFSAGCEKDDSKEAFGNTIIYMPQATVAGLRYAVPSGSDSATYNFKIDNANDKVNILLGVYRSGRQAASSYTVNIVANTDTINQLLAAKVFDPAIHVLLPASMYSLPASVTVPEGKTESTFYLAINKTQLKTYAGKKLLLEVMLTNPSQFALDPLNSKTIVIIDVNALKL